MSTIMKLLFICHGNICRSPMAEFIMRHLVAEAGLSEAYEIASAAVSREEIGNDVYPPAKATLRAHGVPFEHRQARQVTPADYAYYDRLIVMDNSNLRWIARIIPTDPEGKISLMMDEVGEHRDVADPWYTGDFERTYQDLLRACQAICMLVKDKPAKHKK